MDTTYTRSNLDPHAFALAAAGDPGHESTLEMDARGRITLDPEGIPLWYDAGTPEAVWNGRVLQWSIDPTTDAEALDLALADETSQLRRALEAVHAGHEVYWDGSNFVGRSTTPLYRYEDPVPTALREFENSYAGPAVWDATVWFLGNGEAPLQVLTDIHPEHRDDWTLETLPEGRAVGEWLTEAARGEAIVYNVDAAAEELLIRAREALEPDED